MVTCNGFRDPALLAKMASTVDVLSHIADQRRNEMDARHRRGVPWNAPTKYIIDNAANQWLNDGLAAPMPRSARQFYGITAVSSRISSKVASIALPLVAPKLKRVAWVVKPSEVLLANGLPNAVSPIARYTSSTALPPAPFFWCRPTR